MNKVKYLTCKIIIYLFNCLPIKKNKVLLYSYYGSQYSCNPKYITEYILKHYSKDRFDLVWAFTDLTSQNSIDDFRKVRMMSLKYFYELCTAKVVITNFRTTDLFIKRKNQYYIQTWHSSLRLKQIEKDAEDSLPKHYVKMAKKDSLKCDLLLSGCKRSTEIFKRTFWYDGEIFEYGIPRNDLLIRKNHNNKEKLYKKLNIPSENKVLLYAPTFRKDNKIDVYKLDYLKLTEKLERKFGGKWVVLVRLHPHLIHKSSELIYGSNMIDVTSYDDIQELLLISDVLITDYSSLMFDFALTNRPCFLYVPDIDTYTKKERELYFDLEQLPFISVKSIEELLNEVDHYDIEVYRRKLRIFLHQIGSFENGYACKYLAERVYQVCFDEMRSVLNEAV